MSLQEQYIKGELEKGFYYIDGGEIDYFYNFSWSGGSGLKEVEVLAKVPTYEEYQALIKEKTFFMNSFDCCDKMYKELEQENTDLKSELAKYKKALENVKETNGTGWILIGSTSAFVHRVKIEEIVSQALNQEKGSNND